MKVYTRLVVPSSATLAGATATDTVVTLNLTGTATLTGDYVPAGLTATGTAGRYTITIPAGQTSASFTVDPVGDNTYEGPETVVATIASAVANTSANLSVTTASATGTIHDEGGSYDSDLPTLTIAKDLSAALLAVRTQRERAADDSRFDRRPQGGAATGAVAAHHRAGVVAARVEARDGRAVVVEHARVAVDLQPAIGEHAGRDHAGHERLPPHPVRRLALADRHHHRPVGTAQIGGGPKPAAGA